MRKRWARIGSLAVDRRTTGVDRGVGSEAQHSELRLQVGASCGRSSSSGLSANMAGRFVLAYGQTLAMFACGCINEIGFQLHNIRMCVCMCVYGG